MPDVWVHRKPDSLGNAPGHRPEGRSVSFSREHSLIFAKVKDFMLPFSIINPFYFSEHPGAEVAQMRVIGHGQHNCGRLAGTDASSTAGVSRARMPAQTRLSDGLPSQHKHGYLFTAIKLNIICVLSLKIYTF